ncbi:MAG: 4-(cytidine 5'-diphospho)-2-C-methyl-D-erythritol kinase [Clostridia bacterium]|nr:4-(cytidine 5'-diphospho)-2-C-methyl-D-erythritol kinase [Clostridia bacterium]
MIVEELALAKLNLTLGVLYKREDGYHALDTVMQTVSLFDRVFVEKSHAVEIRVTGMTLPENNTMTKAAKLYKEATGCGALVRCEKRIPAEAGMGGGSADAAAVLRGLQRLHRMADDRTLREIALKVGADVPFCLVGGTCRCEGVGEILTPFALGRRLWFVIAKPKDGVSTRELFSRLPLPRPRVRTLSAVAALAKGDLNALAPLMQNVLEPAAIELVPKIGILKQKLLDAGAIAAQMTGSGSAVFGLFGTEDAAKAALPAVSDAAFSTVCHSL